MDESAHEIYTWIQAACWDMANGNESEAEKNYNDPVLITDLLEDRIFDREDMDEILLDLIDYAHTALLTAIEKLIR